MEKGKFLQAPLSKACAGGTRSAQGFFGGGVVYGYSPSTGLLVPAWALPSTTGGTPSNGSYKPGVYVVNPVTSAVRPLAQFTGSGVQANEGAAGDGWVIWEQVSNSSQNWQLYAQNVATGQHKLIYTPPSGFIAAGDAIGLTVAGHSAYWLAVLRNQSTIRTVVYRYDLETNRLTSVISAPSNKRPWLIGDLFVSGSTMLLTTQDSTNPYDLSARGQILRLDMSTSRISTELTLEYPATYVAASGNLLSFVFNSSGKPNSPTNTTPFPLFTYAAGSLKVSQVTVPTDQPEFPSASGRYLAWWNVGQYSTLLDTGKNWVFQVPGRAYVYGTLLTWGTADGVSWCTLR